MTVESPEPQLSDRRVTRPVLALALAVVLGALLRYVLGLAWPVLAAAVVAVFLVSGLVGFAVRRVTDRRGGALSPGATT